MKDAYSLALYAMGLGLSLYFAHVFIERDRRCMRIGRMLIRPGVFAALMPLALIAVFRWNVGVDSLYGGTYWEAYRASAQGINERSFEWGFYGLMRLFSKNAAPYYWFLFAHGIVFFVLISFAIGRGSVNALWSIAVFFLSTAYFDAYSSLRQSLAEAVCLVGWAAFYRSGSRRRYDGAALICFLLAGVFHMTAWMNIPLCLACRIRFKRGADVLLLALLMAALTPVNQKVIGWAMRLAYGNKYTVEGMARINIIVTGVLFFMCWSRYDRLARLFPGGYRYVNHALWIFVLILNSGAMYLPYRAYDMLKIGYIFIVPAFVGSIRSRKARMAAGIMTAAIFAATFLNYYFQPNSFIAHYATALSDWRHIIELP